MIRTICEVAGRNPIEPVLAPGRTLGRTHLSQTSEAHPVGKGLVCVVNDSQICDDIHSVEDGRKVKRA